MNDWIPVVVAVIAAMTALAGYMVNGRLNRINVKARYYADALGAVERYKQLPYTIYRRHDSTAQIRAELATVIGETQAVLAFHRGWLELDSPVVGAAYSDLVDKIRERNSTYRRRAFESTPCTDADIENVRTAIDFVYNSYPEKVKCILIMRRELRFAPVPWFKPNVHSQISDASPAD